MVTNKLLVNRILQVHEPSATRLGLDRLEEDRLILAFGRWAEGQIKKWIDYAKGALLFVMVPDDPESGMFYVYDGHTRRSGWWTRCRRRASGVVGWRNSSNWRKRMA